VSGRNSPMPAGRATRRSRRAAIFGTVAGLVIAGVIVGVNRFSFDAFKPRVEAALSSATGRQVVIHGRLGLALSLHPTIAVNDVTVANPAGFSRPDTATIQSLDVQLALLPLLHRQVSVDSLVVEKPDILLERTASGAVNWQFAPAPKQAAATVTPGGPQTVSRPMGLSLSRVRIENARIAYRDDRTGHVAAADVRELTLTSAGADAPMQVGAQGVVNGLMVDLAGQTGSLAGLQTPAKPWPVALTLTAAEAKLAVEGGIAEPVAGKGYNLAVNASVPDLAALRPLAPKAGLPALHNVTLAAHVADSGGPIPAISSVVLHTGAGDLGPLMPGLTVTQASLSVPALDQPVTAELAGSLKGAPLSFSGTVGPVSKLLTGQPAGPFPINVSAKSGASSFSAKGGIADPAHLTGMDVAVAAATPDLAALGGLAGRPLPKLTNVSFSGQVRDLGGLAKGVSFTGMKFASAQGDLAGDVSLVPGKPPSIKGKLASNQLDLDAMQAAVGAPPAAPAGQPTPAAPAAAPAPARARGPVISNKPLPFNELHQANADLGLTVGTLVIQGQTWRNVVLQVSLENGRLRVEPFKATLPAGALDAAITADANPPAPPVSVRLSAPAIGMKPLLAALGQPGFASGTADVQADLQGAGATAQAIAGSLNGTMSVTMGGGRIDTAVLEKLLGPALARANPGGLLAHGGTSDIKCLAVRMVAHDGVATLNPIMFSSGLVTASGSGTVNLRAQTLDLHLFPQGRIGGTGFEVPLTVTGSLADPHAALNQTGAANAGFQAVIGALAGKNMAGALLPAGPTCATAMAEARGPAAPASAAPKPAAAVPHLPQKLPNAGKLLQQLFRP
jgi:AsmA protein